MPISVTRPGSAGLAFCLLLLAAAPAAAGALEDDVFETLNFVRAHPGDYARELRRDAGGLPGQDAEAVEEAIAALSRQPPLPPLLRDDRLDAAAEGHAAQQSARGGVGHVGAGGETLGQRLRRQGVWAGLTAEDISYGYDNPRAVVAQLVIDSGVQSRGHRKNILNPAYQRAGVGCGPHRTQGAMCVIDFAGVLVER
ncbi:CAP domain-containing protein [Caulobacter sp. CCUG 60055]|uniref:CAP domain-containing protein n=1 Tax=Caulobacter sp. CCUG 60055 TaxID=2100090 RepID=UPI001FA81179|nr:CAP domain-containing protein [Caulobacter sp. CCUG 60055]MBQ1543197.1 hypothetical protein [Caulobacteraceae bacterium]